MPGSRSTRSQSRQRENEYLDDLNDFFPAVFPALSSILFLGQLVSDVDIQTLRHNLPPGFLFFGRRHRGPV
jgi:hypothetical protein